MSDGVIAYTCEEIRRLLHQTLWHVRIPPAAVAAQSIWRRTRQATAKRLHYRRRERLNQETLL
jgi:hypothetical protein